MQATVISPKVSVIIPAYNAEKTLLRCVDSIRKQTLRNLEIIIINDGSTDSTSIICDELAKEDNRIIVIHQQNTGQGLARNRGLEIAKGEYIGFIDSDDEMNLNGYNDMYKKSKEVKADICLIPATIETTCNRTVYRNNHIKDKFYSNKEEILNAIRKGILFGGSCCTAMFSNKLIQKYSLLFPDIKIYISEDMVFSLHALFNSNVIIVLSKPYYHIYHEIAFASFSTSYRKDRLEKLKEMYFKIIEIYEQYKVYEASEQIASVYFKDNAIQLLKTLILNTKKQAIEEIKILCNDDLVQKISRNFIKSNINFKQKILFYFIRLKLYRIIYLLFKIEKLR